MEKKVALELRGISKSFGKIQANKNVDLTVYEGEILSVLGENGCGKTTLMNMIAGIYYPDEGTISVRGQEVDIQSPKDAFLHGIGLSILMPFAAKLRAISSTRPSIVRTRTPFSG